MLSVSTVLRIVIVLIAGAVVASLLPLIASEWRAGGACPKLGPLPACYVVGAAYTAMGVAALIGTRSPVWLFLLGWLPVFGLAAVGTSLEIFGRPTCPLSSSGIPLCYFSLALALFLLPAFLFSRRV